MKHVKGFKCINCGQEYGLDEVEYTCGRCSGNLDVVYNYDYIKETCSRKDIEESPT